MKPLNLIQAITRSEQPHSYYYHKYKYLAIALINLTILTLSLIRYHEIQTIDRIKHLSELHITQMIAQQAIKQCSKPLYDELQDFYRQPHEILVRVSFYNATGNPMANNKYPEPGYVATSDRSIPFNSKIIINDQTYTVGDRTAKWVHQSFPYPTIDIFLNETDEQLIQRGSYTATATIYYNS